MERRSLDVRLNLFGVGMAVAIVLALGLGTSVVASVAVATRAYTWKAQQEEAANQTISVKGYARERIRADLATWRITAIGTGPTLAQAFDNVTQNTEAVRAMLLGRGFVEDELRLEAIETEPIFARDDSGNRTTRVEAYQLNRAIVVRTDRVDRVHEASGELTDLLGQGVRLTPSAPSYTIADAEPMKIRLIGLATDNARLRAAEIAGNAGGVLGPIRSATQGVLQITQPASTSVSSYGQYDTGTIEKDISIVMTVVFGVGAGG